METMCRREGSRRCGRFNGTVKDGGGGRTGDVVGPMSETGRLLGVDMVGEGKVVPGLVAVKGMGK